MVLAAALLALVLATTVDWPSPPLGGGLAVCGAATLAIAAAVYSNKSFFRKGLLLFGQAALQVAGTLCVLRLQWNKCRGTCYYPPLVLVLDAAPAVLAGECQSSWQPSTLWPTSGMPQCSDPVTELQAPLPLLCGVD